MEKERDSVWTSDEEAVPPSIDRWVSRHVKVISKRIPTEEDPIENDELENMLGLS